MHSPRSDLDLDIDPGRLGFCLNANYESGDSVAPDEPESLSAGISRHESYTEAKDSLDSSGSREDAEERTSEFVPRLDGPGLSKRLQQLHRVSINAVTNLVGCSTISAKRKRSTWLGCWRLPFTRNSIPSGSLRVNRNPEDCRSGRLRKLGMTRFGAAVVGLLFAGFSMSVNAVSRRIPPSVRLHSAAAVVRDAQTGDVLLVKNSDVAMPIASITKLMTAMVLLDAKLDMAEIITIEQGDKDTVRHSRSHLPIGTRLTRRQALLVALMASENRAAHALGRTFPGGIAALVTAMNVRARVLGLNETRFVDSTGLSEGNQASAKDLTRLVEEACRYPQICAFSTQPECKIQRGRRQLHFLNTNALIRNSHWRIGLSKTGYIEEGGRCLVMQTQLGERSVLIVLLNSSGKRTHFADAIRIKQWIEGSASPRTEASKPPHAKVAHSHHS